MKKIDVESIWNNDHIPARKNKGVTWEAHAHQYFEELVLGTSYTQPMMEV